MEGSVFLRELATAATAHKDTLGRTVRLVSDATHTHSHTYVHTYTQVQHTSTHKTGQDPDVAVGLYLWSRKVKLFQHCCDEWR